MVKTSVLVVTLATLFLLPADIDAPYMIPQWKLASAASLYNDKKCLAWVLNDESRGESLAGKRGVLDVVYSRMKQQGKSACEIIQSPHQFSGFRPGMSLQVSKEDLQSLEEARNMSAVVPDATHFYSTDIDEPYWASKFKRIRQIGRHIFFREVKENK